MPRSPRRSRSPEPPRRSSHRGASPSGTRYERSHASSSRRPDDRRPGRYDDDYERDRSRDKDRDRERERERDRERDRDRDRDRDRYRDRSRERETSDRSYEKDRYRGDRYDDDRRRRDDRDRQDDRRRDERDDRRRDDRDDRRRDGNDRERDRVNGHHDSPRRDREPDRSPQPDRIASRSPGAARPIVKPIAAARLADSASPASSPGPQTEEDKQRLKRERLEAWKKARELEKLKDGAKANSATPEPEKKPDVSKVAGKGALPPKPTGFSMGSLGRIGLPLKPGAAPKRTVAALDEDDAAPERKLQKLEDLPEFDPEVQSGNAASLDAIGDDMAAEDVDEDQADVKPDIKPDLDTDNGAVTDTANGSANGHANGPMKMEVDEEDEEDELDKFMRENTLEVKQVNQADAKRQGLLAVDNESDDEPEVRDKQEDSLAKQEEMLQLAASKSRKKDLPTPDHSKIHYEPFRKAFYNPPIEALEMDEEEAELMRLEMDGIKVRGVDVPKPVKNWGAFGLPLVCLEQIRANGWTSATSIQAQAIPAVMSGRDVIGIAKTGSGKTIAFLLPLFRHVKDQRPVGGGEGPIAIIMSPTRELAMQISRECKPFLKALNLRVSCCVGGQSISEDIASMKKGAEIVVCTPGRMIDLLTANNGRVTNLRRCTYLVLDEADRMFDMGFEPQVMKIINNIRPDAQKVLFSATFPKTMEALARKILVKPLEITVGGRSVVADTIDQRVEVRDQDSKFTRLLEILGEMSEKHKEEEDFRTLIFVDRQEWADDLFRDLLQRGYVCSSLHGGKEQVDRDEAIKNFKSGDIPIIVATSVAARGLDVPQLKLVINYDAPNHMEDYVHRAGRTGRAGNTGTCITFITPEQDKFSVDIVRALEASKAFIPPELKNMSDEFLEKIKAGKAKAAGSGFSGKGLERIERKREEKDRAEKHTYGDTSEALSLSSREGAVIPYKPKEQTNLFKPPERDLKNESDYTFTEIKVEIVNGPAPDKITNPALFTSGKNAMAQLPAQTLAALEKAKAEGRSVDAANLAKVVAKLTQSIELTKAEKFGLATAEGPKRTKDPDATDWHAVFPINDYPQKARWKVTNKEHMTLLSEISGASITMRGSYYSPGEEPKIGAEPKLYLLIESNDENKVRAAVDEIRRNLVEGSVAALNNADRGLASTSGRYAV